MKIKTKSKKVNKAWLNDHINDPYVKLAQKEGYSAPFVAAIKGVILSINPLARIVDLSHAIPPYDLRHVSFFLEREVRDLIAEALRKTGFVTDAWAALRPPEKWAEAGSF